MGKRGAAPPASTCEAGKRGVSEAHRASAGARAAGALADAGLKWGTSPAGGMRGSLVAVEVQCVLVLPGYSIMIATGFASSL